MPTVTSEHLRPLRSCAKPAVTFDVALLDLDGVVYVGDEPVAHATEALAHARDAGMRLEFVTNNALRTPEQVAQKLAALGVPAGPEQVATSAQAVAHILRERLPAGSKVLVAGGDGLRSAVVAAGFDIAGSADEQPAAAVLGYDPSLDYTRLAEAALAVRHGALFVAANRDATVPTPRGPMPGMGALTAFVVTATGREPVVAGKPELALHAESVRRSAAARPLVVGDRLDTDIEGAHRAGTPSMLVLTGVTDLRALLSASASARPSFLAADLRGLLRSHPLAEDGRCGRARAVVDDSSGTVSLRPSADLPGGADDRVPDDGLNGVRAVLCAAWDAADRGIEITATAGLGEADVRASSASATGRADRPRS